MSNIFCADIGNYSTVTALLGQPPQIMRSVSADITHKSVMTLNTDTSPTVEINRKRLILGEYATKQKNSQTAVERGKHSPDIVKPFLFAGLHQDFEGIVRYLIPTRDRFCEDTIKKALIGSVHEITVNGTTYKHRVTDIQFYLESDIAGVYAYRNGWLDDAGDCLIIDIGGGTTNYVVMTPEGIAVHRRSIPDVGGVSLANDIINSDLMQSHAHRDNIAFKTCKVMDAVTDGSLIYGNRYDFSPIFDDLLNDWFNRLVDSITVDAREYLADVVNIMFVGGNANLLRDRATGTGYFIPENPQLTNIQALLASVMEAN